MKIGPGSTVTQATIRRREYKLEEKAKEVREERKERIQDMETLDNFAPGSRERKAMADVLLSGIDSVNNEAQEISREKAELQSMRLEAARAKREENGNDGPRDANRTVRTEAEEGTSTKDGAQAAGIAHGEEKRAAESVASRPAVDPEGPPGQIVDERI